MVLRSFFRRIPHWQRRFMAVLVFMLQAGVALTPLVHHDGRRPTAHTERRGNQHSAAHNEQTCIVCAVRVAQARVADRVALPAAERALPAMAIAYVGAVAPRAPPTSNSSRAPPVLS
jgi:hypothetical protein